MIDPYSVTGATNVNDMHIIAAAATHSAAALAVLLT